MAKLLERHRYASCPISDEDDPLRFHYWPVVGHLYRRRIDGCVALLGRGARVLDVGFGSGTTFLELADRFREVHGLDLHDYAGAIRRVFAEAGTRVMLARASVLTAPYRDASFDAVVAMSVLEHLPPAEQPGVMRELHRVIRPGGVVVVGVPGLNWFMTLAFRMMGVDIVRHHFSSPAVVIAALRERFTIDQVIHQPAILPSGMTTYVWVRARRSVSS